MSGSEGGDKDHLNNPMRFSLGNRRIDIEQYDLNVTEIDIRTSEGSLFIHWDTETDNDR